VNERILVVEDNAALAENVAEMLLEEGADVVICADADSAEARAADGGFELAIVDIRLAGNDSGLDLVPRLRRHSAHGEVVLMTGNASLDTAIQAIRRGVYAYLPKPFEPEHLVALVKRALAQVALKRDKQALTQRLAASEALYRSVVETVEACIIGLDADGVIRFANRFVAERAGRSPQRLVGMHFADLCVGAPEPVRAALRQAMRGKPVRDHECTLATAKGDARIIRWTLTHLPEGPGEPDTTASGPVQGHALRILAAGIDVTDRRELERKNGEAEAMAAMGTLTTALAHEIRNPLNAAKLQLELLVRRVRKREDPKLEELLAEPSQLVRTEIDRLTKLLTEFLELARPRQIERLPVSVRTLFDDVIKLEAPVAATAGVQLHTEVAPLELKMLGDADKLKQVIINLVTNAIEALRERGGHVWLRGEPRPVGGVTVSIADDGPGIPRETAASVFTPFVTSKPGGTGLGLAIVQKIVQQHRGDVELVPRPGGGTVARFSVP
jgi:PAS domain S-box-containing protein